MRRKIASPATWVFLVVATGFYLSFSHLVRSRPPFLRTGFSDGINFNPKSPFPSPGFSSSPTTSTESPPAPSAQPDKGRLSSESRSAYINAIMVPEATELPRLRCPKPDVSRYEHLTRKEGDESPVIQYLFAIDLRQCLPKLPRLIGSVVEAIRLLGPRACALSITEGNSDDGTAEVLAALRPELEALKTTYYYRTSAINPQEGDRIAKLAELRNLAVQPLIDKVESARFSAANTTVVFLNDVAICAEDILELIHQRRFQGADMACAMDWTYAGQDPTFYDVWVARGMTGDSFFEIPADGNWNSAWNLFWNDADAAARFAAHQPFQVFSCWNGAVAFTAAPLMTMGDGDHDDDGDDGDTGKGPVRFRRARDGECFGGEPQLFCKDMWFHGYGRIAVVPAVNLEYSDERAQQIKAAKGYTSTWARGPPDWAGGDRINWRSQPPDTVKCIPNYDSQFWEAWNKTQPGT
ncbi:glycosyltransferase family 69 protein [Lasiosphaeria ovina]|uniref:Glycosyltransferase family 69 protein n=1 Tax=Lasiosphaeria ovina TaxID=92902 RepID=A0AAE0KHK1_9PEZI|nr:glycosyltransferase family 69 protein [Lasiosphaeria ovina]